jgi:polynucleotide 5'-kinase involved in rRNA processing
MRIKNIENWEDIPDLLKSIKGSVFILGDVDTGKSTLVEHICSSLSKKNEVGLISADLGQSLFGLPACFSYARVARKALRELEPEKIIFVGSCSPRGNFLKVIIAFQKLLKYAQKNAPVTVIDTDGLVQDNTGKEYKIAMIQAVAKGVVIAIQKQEELAHILRYLKNEASIPVILVQTVPEAQTKSQKDRTDYRLSRFQTYFANRIEKTLPLNVDKIQGAGFGIGKLMDSNTLDVLSKYFDVKALYGEYGKYEFSVLLEKNVEKEALLQVANTLNIRKLNAYSINDLSNLLIGFNDSKGYTKIIGLIKNFDLFQKQLTIYLPYDEDLSSLTCIIGKERIML